MIDIAGFKKLLTLDEFSKSKNLDASNIRRDFAKGNFHKWLEVNQKAEKVAKTWLIFESEKPS